MFLAPGELRENNRQRENRRSDPRLRQERPRIQVRDYVSSMIDRLSEPERRISDNQIKAGFIKLSKYEDPKVIDYFKNTVPLVGDQFTLSYILREGGRQSHQFIRTGENSVFLFIKNWSHPSTRAMRSSAKHLMIESEVLITDQATEDIVRVPNEEGPERDNPRCIYPELYGHVKIERSRHNGDCSCASSMLNFKTCALHAGICMKSEYNFDEKTLSILPEDTALLGRTQRVYVRTSSESGTQNSSSFSSLVPPPFLLFLEWDDRIWVPPFSDLAPSDPLVKILSAYGSDGNYMRSISQIYKMKPNRWGMEHPLLGSPNRHSELYELTKNLHSSEGLYRVSFTLHPLNYKKLSMASTRDEMLRIQETEIENPGDIEESVMCAHLDYFTSENDEEYQVHCCECTPTFSANGKLRSLQKFSRREFIIHYEQEHYGSSVLCGVANEIGTGARIYENLVIYIMSKFADLRANPEKLKNTLDRPLSYNENATRMFGMTRTESDSPPQWGDGPRSKMLRSGDFDRLRNEISGTQMSHKKSKTISVESETEATHVTRRVTKAKKSMERGTSSGPKTTTESFDDINQVLMTNLDVENLGAQINIEDEATLHGI
jgi:hypothetical protein